MPPVCSRGWAGEPPVEPNAAPAEEARITPDYVAASSVSQSGGRSFSRKREKVAGGAGRMRAGERLDMSGLVLPDSRRMGRLPTLIRRASRATFPARGEGAARRSIWLTRGIGLRFSRKTLGIAQPLLYDPP